MPGINKAIILGRLGKDPETRHMPNGNSVTNFSLATSEIWNDKNSGEKKERTEWHKVLTYGKLAEICGKYLSKGREVYVEGKIQTRSWEKDGVTRYSTEIIGQVVQFVGGESRKDDGGYPEPPVPSDDDHEIPF